MTITVGDKSKFAIESAMAKAYARMSFRALGYLVIYVRSRAYGVREPEATMLACSLGRVEEIIARRGRNVGATANHFEAGVIADVYRHQFYAPDREADLFFGRPLIEASEFLNSNYLVWAPDGDEAFDDRSHVLLFDVGDRVRLIAFRCADEGYHHDPSTLNEVWLGADEFYGLLIQWRAAFLGAWSAATKVPEAEDGAERY